MVLTSGSELRVSSSRSTFRRKCFLRLGCASIKIRLRDTTTVLKFSLLTFEAEQSEVLIAIACSDIGFACSDYATVNENCASLDASFDPSPGIRCYPLGSPSIKGVNQNRGDKNNGERL
jgi:hypothetical protein